MHLMEWPSCIAMPLCLAVFALRLTGRGEALAQGAAG